MKVAAIVPAAGQSKRLKVRQPKPFVPVLGKPLFIWTILNLAKSFRFTEIILVMRRSKIREAQRLLKRYGLGSVRVISGGKTRAQSVQNGLKSIALPCDWVLVHDMARPLVTAKIVEDLFKAAKRSGAAICSMPVTDTVKKIDTRTKKILATLDRRSLQLAQTPQVFKKKLLERRFVALGKNALKRTDEASLFDGSMVRVAVAPGHAMNLKITTVEDLQLLKFYLKEF